jgi:hypothetical protein
MFALRSSLLRLTDKHQLRRVLYALHAWKQDIKKTEHALLLKCGAEIANTRIMEKLLGAYIKCFNRVAVAAAAGDVEMS